MTGIRHVRQADAVSWLRLRHALWPDATEAEHQADIRQFLAGVAREPHAVLVASDDRSGLLVGLAELSIRAYAEGCDTDRVAFLEGWYVAPEFRRRGIARALVAAAEEWATSRGCTEFASDTQVDNEISAAAHLECGFAEVGVMRCFRKDLPNKTMHATCEDAGA
jgi:aminoglycoside 6'-N-acetyltransferase I